MPSRADGQQFKCGECGKPGHFSQTCGQTLVTITLKLPKLMVDDIDKVADRLDSKRTSACSRLIIEALGARNV